MSSTIESDNGFSRFVSTSPLRGSSSPAGTIRIPASMRRINTTLQALLAPPPPPIPPPPPPPPVPTQRVAVVSERARRAARTAARKAAFFDLFDL
jgi:hypothetical protein